MALKFGNPLDGLDRCPQCNVAAPLLQLVLDAGLTELPNPQVLQRWAVFACSKCKRMILAEGQAARRDSRGNTAAEHAIITRLYPGRRSVDASLPPAAKRYLQQAIDTIHAPDASVVMSASAVDAMLKAKGYLEGSLYSRIDKAVAEHVLTEGMGTWAHKVRLEANAVRHADEDASPTGEEAMEVMEFATALGDFLFVFAARVEEGVKRANEQSEPA